MSCHCDDGFRILFRVALNFKAVFSVPDIDKYKIIKLFTSVVSKKNYDGETMTKPFSLKQFLDSDVTTDYLIKTIFVIRAREPRGFGL